MALITPEIAREFAARSVAARAAARAERKRQAEEAENAPLPRTAESDEYTLRRLARVRIQLDKVDKMLAEERDPRRMRDLAAVAKDLEEQERRLSNRSLPPTLKAPARQRSKSSAPAPLDE